MPSKRRAGLPGRSDTVSWVALLAFVTLLSLLTLGGKADILKVCIGCNLAGASLAGADLSNGTYIGTNFAGAHLQGATFRRSKLIAANFEAADLTRVAFDGAECTACNFNRSQLGDATFLNTHFTAANFANFGSTVDGPQVRALLAGCVACNFTGASLAQRDLSGLPLISVDFSKTDLRKTSLNGAALCWYTMDAAKRTIKCDTMAGSDVAGADLRNVTLCVDPIGRQQCTPVDAATLRSETGSNLDGAVLP